MNNITQVKKFGVSRCPRQPRPPQLSIGKKLSIVHCALLILCSFLFVGSLSAQDNYTVVVKCYPEKGGYVEKFVNSSYLSIQYTTSAYTTGGPPMGQSGVGNFTATSFGTKTSFQTRAYSYSTATTMSVFSYTVSGSYPGSTYSFATSQKPIAITSKGSPCSSLMSLYIGWLNFTGVTNAPTYGTVNGNLTMYVYSGGNTNSNSIRIYHPSITPSAANSNVYNSMFSNSLANVSISAGSTRTFQFAGAGLPTTNNSYMLAFEPLLTQSMFNFTWSTADITKKPYLAIKYSAPWSKVVGWGVATTRATESLTVSPMLSATSQTPTTTYLPVTPGQSWKWYSATASGGPYNSMATTNLSTYQVSPPSMPGTVWYRYDRTVVAASNSTLSLLNTSSVVGTALCNPQSIYYAPACEPINSNNPPSFSATPSDRSVTLSWNNLGANVVDHYVIRYGVEGGVGFKEITVAGNATSKLIERLTNGRSYYFQIQAIGASGYCDTQLSTKTYLTPNCP